MSISPTQALISYTEIIFITTFILMKRTRNYSITRNYQTLGPLPLKWILQLTIPKKA